MTSIIKAVQTWLAGYDGMILRPLSEILTDLPEECAPSFALAAAGNGKVSEDILGNRIHQNSYVFYARETAANEIDRADMYHFLEGLTNWVEEQNASRQLPELPEGYEADSVEVSNAMLMEVDENGMGLYQVQIQFVYTKGV